MGAAHRAGTGRHRRRQNPLRLQFLQQPAHAHDVRHGVQAAHLMEMHLLHRLAVYLTLRLRQQRVYLQRILPHPLWDV